MAVLFPDEMKVMQAVSYLQSLGFRMSRGTLYNLVYHKELHNEKRGGSLILKKSELDAWAKRRTEVRRAFR